MVSRIYPYKRLGRTVFAYRIDGSKPRMFGVTALRGKVWAFWPQGWPNLWGWDAVDNLRVEFLQGKASEGLVEAHKQGQKLLNFLIQPELLDQETLREQKQLLSRKSQYFFKFLR